MKDVLCCLWSSDWKLYEHQRIVLVGHSFGGLVIKSMIVEAHKRLMKRGMVPGTRTTAKGLTETMDFQCREFLKHIRHIIFYAVPHLGTHIANYAKVLNSVVSLRLAGIVDNLKPFQMEMEELSDDFQRAIRQNPPIPIYAIAETRTYMQVKSLPKQQQFPLCAVSKMTDFRSFNMQISIFPMNLQFYQSSTTW